MPENIFPLDSSKKFTEQEKLGHNRWHPEIPPVATVKPGDSFRVDCREWFDGAIKNDDSAQDILDAPLLTVHTLSGPFAVEGAKRNGRHSGICGQAPSDHPEIAKYLVELGIDSISLTPDTVLRTMRALAEIEAKRA